MIAACGSARLLAMQPPHSTLAYVSSVCGQTGKAVLALFGVELHWLDVDWGGQLESVAAHMVCWEPSLRR